MSDPAVFQNAFYIGNNFNAILYGVELVLYFMTVRTMLSRKHKRVPSDKWFVLFASILLFLNTVFVATEAVFGEEMWIVNANYPGGMNAYLEDFASVWYQTFGTAASILLNLLADGLMIYRVWVVWDDLRVVVAPLIIYLATFSLGIAQLVESGKPASNYFAGLAKNLGIAYTSCIISLNIITTALVTGRIYAAGRRFAESMGADVGRAYTGAAAIMVESSALSTLSGIAYLVTFALGSDLEIFFLSIYVMCTCIAPQLIVLRVMSGRAWTRDKSSMVHSQLEFTNRSTTHVGGGLDADEKLPARKRSNTMGTKTSASDASDVV